ncbi:MAG: hypothetical protein ACE5EO_03560 [Candidatus Krumholzibacteriia bacterium]
MNLEIIGAKVSGRFNKNATIFTNDPKHPRMTVSIAGKILRYVEVTPSNRIFLRGMYGESVSKELTITSSEKKNDFKIVDLSSNIDDKITYKAVAQPEPGTYKIRLFKNPKLPTMNTWGSLTITTNSEHAPEKKIQVNVTTRGSIVVQPSTLNFGSVSGESRLAGVEKSLTVFKVKGEFSIKDIKFTTDAFRASVEPIEEGRKYQVKVNFQPGTQAQAYLDEMIINTDDPQEPALRVRLRARKL